MFDIHADARTHIEGEHCHAIGMRYVEIERAGVRGIGAPAHATPDLDFGWGPPEPPSQQDAQHCAARDVPVAQVGPAKACGARMFGIRQRCGESGELAGGSGEFAHPHGDARGRRRQRDRTGEIAPVCRFV